MQESFVRETGDAWQKGLAAPAKLKEAEKGWRESREGTAETAKPRDVTLTVYSAPINLKITPSPTASAK